GESGHKTRRAGKHVGERRQSRQIRGGWSRQGGGDEVRIVDLGLPVDPILGQQVNPASPEIPELGAPVFSKLALVAASVSNRIRHFLIRNPCAGDSSSRNRIGHRRKHRQDPATRQEVRSLGGERRDIDSLLRLRRVRQYVYVVEYHVVGH